MSIKPYALGLALTTAAWTTLGARAEQPPPQPLPSLDGQSAPSVIEFVPQGESFPAATVNTSAAPTYARVVEAPQPAPCYDQPCAPKAGLSSYWNYRVKPWLQATHWGYCENFQAPPLGASVYGAMSTQVANGQAAQLVLYQYDFHDGLSGPPSELNAFGRKRLRKLGRLLWESPLPLAIEPMLEHDEINEARRLAVLEELARILPAPLPPERVIVVDLAHSGLSGEEAELIHRNLLEQTRRAPVTIPTGGGEGGFLRGQGVRPVR